MNLWLDEFDIGEELEEIRFSLAGVPQIPDAADRHFRAGNEDLPEHLIPATDEAIAAAMEELTRRHLQWGKRGVELDHETFSGEYW